MRCFFLPVSSLSYCYLLKELATRRYSSHHFWKVSYILLCRNTASTHLAGTPSRTRPTFAFAGKRCRRAARGSRWQRCSTRRTTSISRRESQRVRLCLLVTCDSCSFSHNIGFRSIFFQFGKGTRDACPVLAILAPFPQSTISRAHVPSLMALINY